MVFFASLERRKLGGGGKREGRGAEEGGLFIEASNAKAPWRFNERKRKTGRGGGRKRKKKRRGVDWPHLLNIQRIRSWGKRGGMKKKKKEEKKNEVGASVVEQRKSKKEEKGKKR